MLEKFRKEIWVLIVILAVFTFLSAINGRYKVVTGLKNNVPLYFDSWTQQFYRRDGQPLIRR